MFINLYHDFKNLLSNLKIDKNTIQKVKKNLIDNYISKKNDTPWKKMDFYIHNKLVNDILPMIIYCLV